MKQKLCDACASGAGSADELVRSNSLETSGFLGTFGYSFAKEMKLHAGSIADRTPLVPARLGNRDAQSKSSRSRACNIQRHRTSKPALPMGPSSHRPRCRSRRSLPGDSACRELSSHVRRTDANIDESRFGFMGLVSLSCTILDPRIALWELPPMIESNRLRLFPSKLLNHPPFHA